MLYPAQITTDSVGFLVTFRDVPEAISAGDTLEEAQEMASEALLLALLLYPSRKKPFPTPSDFQHGDVAISIGLTGSVKLMLNNELRKRGLKTSEFAKRLGVSPRTARRILQLDEPIGITNLHKAFDALGLSLQIKMSPYTQ